MYGENYLAHYGIPGMKWGVRRAMGKRSREAARLGRIIKGEKKVLDTSKNRLSKNEEYGIESSPSLSKTVKNSGARIKMYESRYKELTKGLSDKDLAQGRRGAVGRTIVAGLLAGPLGAVAVEGILSGVAYKRAQS